MNNIVMLFAYLAIGMLLRWTTRCPKTRQRRSIRLEPALFYSVLMPWLLFVASAALFGLVGYYLALPRATTGALVVRT